MPPLYSRRLYGESQVMQPQFSPWLLSSNNKESVRTQVSRAPLTVTAELMDLPHKPPSQVWWQNNVKLRRQSLIANQCDLQRQRQWKLEISIQILNIHLDCILLTRWWYSTWKQVDSISWLHVVDFGNLSYCSMFCTPSFNHHACIVFGIDFVSELIKFANGDGKISCLQIESGLAGLTLHPVESIAFLLFLSSPAAGKDVNSGPSVGRILLINSRNALHNSPLHSCLLTTI